MLQIVIACVAALSALSTPAQAREVLVTTDWVYQNLKSPNVRLVEVSVDPGVYEQGHVQGAVGFKWHSELCDPVGRDVVSPEKFAELCQARGDRATTRRSCSTATTTTGSPAGASGSSRCTATRTCG